MGLVKSLSGQRFGRLVALSFLKREGNSYIWLCRCDCGTEITLTRTHLVDGNTKSCGCYRREVALEKIKHTHTGRTKDRHRWLMWNAAKHRARRQGVPFAIDLEDIIIPKVCPLLGIPLAFGNGKVGKNSPTLDKVIPSKGYVPMNIWVISLKANTMKNSASLEEMELLLSNWKRLIGLGSEVS